MTPLLTLLLTSGALAQDTAQLFPMLANATAYAGLQSTWQGELGRWPVDGGVDVIVLTPQLRARARVLFQRQPDAALAAAMGQITEQPPGELETWLGNHESLEGAWRSPAGVVAGLRVDRVQAFGGRGMRYLMDELRIAPDHDRSWIAGPTLGALFEFDHYDLGGQLWYGLPVTTRMTPGVEYGSPAETPSPRDLISTRLEVTALARYHHEHWFASLEAGARARQRSRYQAEVLELGRGIQRDPILRVSAGIAI